MEPGFAIFATAIGDCAIAWNAVGLTGVWLPDASATRLRARIVSRRPGVVEVRPPGTMDAAVGAITALLRGERTDLTDVPIDERALDAFDGRVYNAARTIPPGRVITYSALAERVGPTATAREVGQALGRNPFPIVVPCHRIVAAGGQLGGFSAPGGATTKRRLLTIEDARLAGAHDLFDSVDSGAPRDR